MAIEVSVHHPNSANDTLVGFVQDPDGRGTLSILFSCLVTLGLCVFSAIHLDLPKHDESETHYLLRYCKWSIVGVFGPEILIWVAWRQYLSARVLTQCIKETAEPGTAAAQQWTLTHSFYTGMGGFVFDLSENVKLDNSPFVPDLRRLHVTPRGMQLLAKCGRLPGITRKDLEDKNKTDGLGKLICCAQVTWILITAITRLAVNLPVTPLEVNTIGHVVCALMIYTLWWSKPRWVQEPTVLRGDWTRAMCAFMYMSSQVSAERRAQQDLLRNFGVGTEIAGTLYVPNSTSSPGDSSTTAADTQTTTSETSAILKPRMYEATRSTSRSCASGEQTTSVNAEAIITSTDFSSETPSTHEALEVMRQARWKLCCEAIERYPALQERLKVPECSADELRYRQALQLYPEMPPSVQRRFKSYDRDEEHAISQKTDEWICISEELVVDRPRNWPGDDLIRHMQGHLMGMVMWCASTVYGAIHLAGWNDIFPTTIELWFWRGSAAYIVFSGLLWSFFNLLGHCSGSVWLYWYDLLAGDVRRRSHLVIFFFSCIGGTLYAVARIYLVAEAFISLRALPGSAYASPQWVVTIPHVG